MKPALFLAAFATLAVAMPRALATDADGFAATYAAAQTAERQAGALHHQWTTTEADLKAAQAAAARHDNAAAIRLAQEAAALARLSIAQAQDQDAHWRDAVVQ